jgi:hypothetical protein
MAWKNFPLAITSRRRLAATALVYGLSLTVRLTSATGEEARISAQAVQPSPMNSIVINDGAHSFPKGWPPIPDARSSPGIVGRCRP